MASFFNKNKNQTPMENKTEKKPEKKKMIDPAIYEYDSVKKVLKQELLNLSNRSYGDKGLNFEEYEKLEARRANIRDSESLAPFGDLNSKKYIKSILKRIMQTKYDCDFIDSIYNFVAKSKIDTTTQFNIILYKYKQKYGYRALEKFIEDNKFADEPRYLNDQYYFCITKEDIKRVFESNEDFQKLTVDNKIDLFIDMIYAEENGLGVIDEIRDQNIDGISGGVNGIVDQLIAKEDISDETIDKYLSTARNYDSVWIMFKSKKIHMEFLSFGSLDELKRICENIYKYGGGEQLSEEKGYSINDLVDGSRVVVLRPPYCESWVFFIRMFESVEVKELSNLFSAKNAEYLIGLAKYLMKGAQTTILTGEQGSGKTTMMIALIKEIYAMYTIRILDNMFETRLRKSFPVRNIVSVREIENIKADTALSVFKKTDGDVTIVAESADANAIASLIEVGQVGSKFTMTTHHATTFRGLVNATRNSLLNTGLFKNEDLAEEQVVNVIKFNIHLKVFNGVRAVARITECIPIDKEVEYDYSYRNKDLGVVKKFVAFLDNIQTYMEARTKRRHYTYKDIIVYDERRKKYIVKNRISDDRLRDMRANLLPLDAEEFDVFIEECFSNVKEN